MKLGTCVSAIALLAVFSVSSQSAQADRPELYFSVTGGGSFLSDSDNSGEFTSEFLTGEGTTIPAGTALGRGVGVGWTTEFDTGWTVSGALGMRWYENLRTEIELAYQANDIDTHVGVSTAGIPLGAEDAGVLITGSGNLGVSVADLVADGQGSVDTFYVMGNMFYDFGDESWIVRPYLGGGIGVGVIDVDYSPSNVTIIDENDTQFAYQVMAGLATEIAPGIDLVGGYRYRSTLDAEVDVGLFPATLDIENSAHIVEAGLRVAF